MFSAVFLALVWSESTKSFFLGQKESALAIRGLGSIAVIHAGHESFLEPDHFYGAGHESFFSLSLLLPQGTFSQSRKDYQSSLPSTPGLDHFFSVLHRIRVGVGNSTGELQLCASIQLVYLDLDKTASSRKFAVLYWCARVPVSNFQGPSLSIPPTPPHPRHHPSISPKIVSYVALIPLCWSDIALIQTTTARPLIHTHTCTLTQSLTLSLPFAFSRCPDKHTQATDTRTYIFQVGHLIPSQTT